MSIYRNAALLLGVLGSASLAWASSHSEAPAISTDRVADNTDLYAWVKPGTRDLLYILANYNGLQEPSGGPNFFELSEDVRYEVHVIRGGKKDEFDDSVLFRVTLSSNEYPSGSPTAANTLGTGVEFFKQLAGREQRFTVRRFDRNANGSLKQTCKIEGKVAPYNIGPRTDAVVYKPASGKYDDDFAATFIASKDCGGGLGTHRVFIGPRDDGFYVDLGGVFDLANLRAKGVAKDAVAGYNVHTIALEIPAASMTADKKLAPAGATADNTLGIWASASRQRVTVRLNDGYSWSFGPWVQVSRLGLPLVNEVIIGLQDKDYWNSQHPRDEAAQFAAYYLNPTIVRDAEAVGIYKALGADPTPFKTNRGDILDVVNLRSAVTPGHEKIENITDVLRVDLGIESGFPNGRPLSPGKNTEQADVVDVLSSYVLTKTLGNIKDGVDYNDKTFLTTFPFLALPWRGYDEGHGKTTP